MKAFLEHGVAGFESVDGELVPYSNLPVPGYSPTPGTRCFDPNADNVFLMKGDSTPSPSPSATLDTIHLKSQVIELDRSSRLPRPVERLESRE